jgi:deoxyhypusine synthase
MRRSDILRTRVEDIELDSISAPSDLVAGMGRGGGFTAKKIADGVDILRTMFRRRGCTTFLSFPAALMATGVRGVLRGLVERKLVDAVITTCGTADHDLARVWQPYYHGDFEMDDAALHRLGVNRLGNVLVPNESYGIVLEKRIQPMLADLWSSGLRSPTTKELLWELGRRTGSRGSLLWWAWENRIPVYVPAITDGAVGYQLWSFWQDHKDFRIDLFRDEAELADLVFAAKEAGALMIGGGVSKHHTIWWAQFRGGLDYAVYITTAPEWDGSLSGARVREGISWGKVKESARQVTVEGDASALLPLMIRAALGPRSRRPGRVTSR